MLETKKKKNQNLTLLQRLVPAGKEPSIICTTKLFFKKEKLKILGNYFSLETGTHLISSSIRFLNCFITLVIVFNNFFSSFFFFTILKIG